jgi:hypothetical protein
MSLGLMLSAREIEFFGKTELNGSDRWGAAYSRPVGLDFCAKAANTASNERVRTFHSGTDHLFCEQRGAVRQLVV